MENQGITFQRFVALTGAYMLDAVISLPLQLGITALFLFFFGSGFLDSMETTSATTYTLVYELTRWGIVILYFVVMETWKGASLGKLAVGIYTNPKSLPRLLGAYILDILGIVICCYICVDMVFKTPSADPIGPSLLNFFLFIALYFMNFIVLEALSGASLGKWIFGLRVYQKLK